MIWGFCLRSYKFLRLLNCSRLSMSHCECGPFFFFLRTFLAWCRCQLGCVASFLRDWKIEHVFVPVAIQLQKNPTTLCRTLQVSQRAIVAARGGYHATLSQTARQNQRVAQNRRVSQQSPNRSNQRPKSKGSQSERRSDWQMWRR